MTPVERVAEAMEAANEKTILVDWDCMADETVVNWMALAQAAVKSLSPTIRQEHDAADYLQQRLLSAGMDEAGIGWCTDIVRGLLPFISPIPLTPREAARKLTRLSEEWGLYDGEDEA